MLVLCFVGHRPLPMRMVVGAIIHALNQRAVGARSHPLLFDLHDQPLRRRMSDNVRLVRLGRPVVALDWAGLGSGRK